MRRMAVGVLMRRDTLGYWLLCSLFTCFLYLAVVISVTLFTFLCPSSTFFFFIRFEVVQTVFPHTPRSLHCFIYASHYPPPMRTCTASHIASHTESDLRRCANFFNLFLFSHSYRYHSSFLPLEATHRYRVQLFLF